MQKIEKTSVNSKLVVLDKIIKNLTDSDDVCVEVAVDEIMSELPKQTILIRIRKNADVIVYNKHPAFDEY